MIKDIEFAFFSQLAYLKWNKLDMDNLRYDEVYTECLVSNYL